MEILENIFLTALRDEQTKRPQFRFAASGLAEALAHRTIEHLKVITGLIKTPIAQATGVWFRGDVVLVPILRSGLALLPAFVKYFSDAVVGFVGLRRDEKTAIAQLYYCKLPKIKNEDQVIILDPMIATGGTAIETIQILINKGVAQEQIIFVAVVCAPEGLDKVSKMFPKVKFIVAARDKGLNDKKFIIPGLGDFGDRFFGTE
jgi:uracil phosphoribosyltransferase